MRKRHTVFILGTALMLACGSNETSEENSVEGSDTLVDDTSDVVVNPDSLPDGIAEDYPMLVIENMSGLWPEPCEPTDQTQDQAIEEALEFLGTDQLISIGRNGIQKQELLRGFCMNGECGGSQIAFELLNEEAFGVITTENFMSPEAVFHQLEGAVEFEGYISDVTETDSTYKETTVYVNMDQTRILHLEGNGYVQESQWPFFNEVKWQLLTKDGNKWKENDWVITNIKSTNLPRPVAIIDETDYTRIIWYQGVGICCPSESSSWSTEVKFGADGVISTTKEQIYPGGLGQPCD